MELPPESESIEEAQEGRTRRRRRRDKDNTPLGKAFQASMDADFPTHVVAGDTPVQGTKAGGNAEVLKALATLGYLEGEAEAPADWGQGVSDHDPARAVAGYNLFTPGGHSIAVLMDMKGVVRHQWSFQLTDAWPAFEAPKGTDFHAQSFRRAQLMPNGDLVALWSGYGIVRIDKDSKLIWGHFLPVHHDLHVFDDGRVLVLTRAFRDHERYGKQPVVEDYLTWLRPDGSVEGSISVLEAFEAYEGFDEVWESRPKKDPDLFHTNTIFVLERDYTHAHPAFRKGRILTSMRHLSALALIDPGSQEVVWHMKGSFSRQHDPQIVDSGALMLFDNRGGRGETSRMLEYALGSGELVWSYVADPPAAFAASVCGHAQRLHNGNTLVNNATMGEAFEITREGEVVWRYRSPYRTSRVGKTISRNYEFWRVPAVEVQRWLSANP